MGIGPRNSAGKMSLWMFLVFVVLVAFDRRRKVKKQQNATAVF
jgi:hypothetical protein